MYGLILEGIACYLREVHGQETWEEILYVANVSTERFGTSDIYSESTVNRIVTAAQEVINQPLEQMMESIGYKFCEFAATYDYDKIIRVLGRRFTDFMNGLDSLHEYLRFTYPKMKPPSFYCENESRTGLTLHYRSKRRGFMHYVKGQIKYISKTYYGMDVKLEVLDQSNEDNMEHTIFRLHYNNFDFGKKLINPNETEDFIRANMKVTSDIFFDVFPFIIVFNRGMHIRNIGLALMRLMPKIIGRRISDEFVVLKPTIRFRWEDLIWYLNNVFELMSVEPIFSDHTGVVSRHSEGIEMANDRRRMMEPERSKFFSLKGQMIYMDEWESICFLGNPIVVNLKQMYGSGLYINDFALHDSSRDLVLTSTLQSAELKLLLDQEAQKGLKLQENTEMLKSAREKTDQLLYQLLPKSVADQLRKGVSAVETCESFDSVTILFTDIVGFTSICSNITPIAVVNFLNHMYSVFDALTAQHAVFKVETIGDAYMIVGGAPVKNIYHAEYVCDCALSIMKSVEKMKEATSKRPIQIRAGVHSGNVVAGVVGLQMPRYCLFGENVAVANRMESTGKPMKIQVSETTKKALDDLELNSFLFSASSPVDIGNQKQLETFWLDCKNGPPRPPPLEDEWVEDEDEIVDPEAENRYTPVSTVEIDRLSSRPSSVVQGAE